MGKGVGMAGRSVGMDRSDPLESVRQVGCPGA